MSINKAGPGEHDLVLLFFTPASLHPRHNIVTFGTEKVPRILPGYRAYTLN